MNGVSHLQFRKHSYTYTSNRTGYFLACLLFAVSVIFLSKELFSHVNALESWIASLGPWAFIVFLLIYVILCSVLVPESLLGIIAGFTFGIIDGLWLVMIGNLIAAILQYSLACTAIRPIINQLLVSKPKLKLIQTAVLKKELKLQMLLRLTPINRSITNYVLGAAGVKMGYYLMACACMLPNLALEVYVGYASKTWVKTATQHTDQIAGHAITTLIGVMIAIVVMILITRTAQKAIRSATQDTQGHPL